MAYPTAASDLRDFYILAGTSAATLVGLLFVGLSLHLRTVIAASEVRGLARVTLSNFGAVLFVSLFMVINEDQTTAAVQLIIAGLVSLTITMPGIIASERGRDRMLRMANRDRVRLTLRFGLSAASYVGIIAAGGLLLASLVSSFVVVLISALFILLVVSLRNTWDLLVTVGEVTMGDEGQK
jgi:hypothetical protein